jgi:hypothetical protein
MGSLRTKPAKARLAKLYAQHAKTLRRRYAAEEALATALPVTTSDCVALIDYACADLRLEDTIDWALRAVPNVADALREIPKRWVRRILPAAYIVSIKEVEKASGGIPLGLPFWLHRILSFLSPDLMKSSRRVEITHGHLST